jgi:hypothetical protein
MSRIVALRGTDGLGGCGCSGMGDATAASAPPPAATPVVGQPAMSPTTMLIWAAVLGTVGYIFWGTLQSPKRRLVS